MAFALHKTNERKSGEKRSPLAGWLGKKVKPEDREDAIPEIDVAAGVNRALRGSRLAEERPARKEQESPVRDALGAIEAALYAIDRIRDTLEQSQEVVMSAKEVDDAGARALLAERYDEMRLSIDSLIDNIDQRAATLVGRSQRHLDVRLGGGKTRYSVSPARLDTSERGLSLSPPREAFTRDFEIDATVEEIDRALGVADRAAAGYCRDAQYLIARMNGAFE